MSQDEMLMYRRTKYICSAMGKTQGKLIVKSEFRSSLVNVSVGEVASFRVQRFVRLAARH